MLDKLAVKQLEGPTVFTQTVILTGQREYTIQQKDQQG